jgi:hydrocephalus-inducing protein
VGHLCFPNLTLSDKRVDFGVVPCDTEKRSVFSITNTSRIPVSYTWSLSQEYSLHRVSPQSPSASSLTATFPAQLHPPLINEVFDIVPIRGHLQPGASDDIEFVFFGFPELVAKATALCEVEGGPVYDLQLIGSAAQPGYQISSTDLDFGFQRMAELATRPVTITNSGSVDFDWDVDLSRVPAHFVPMLRIVPASGVIKAGSSARIDFQLLAILPTNVSMQVVLKLGHFDPVMINVRCSISFPQVVAWLPRVDDATAVAETAVFVERARSYANESPMLRPKTLEKRPSSRYSIYQADKTSFTVPAVPILLLEKYPSLNVNVEADRLQFLGQMEQFSLKQLSPPPSEPSEKLLSLEESLKLAVKQWTLTKYQIDFGNVILGTSTKHTFNVTNIYGFPIKLSINNQLFLHSVFKVEPIKLDNMQPGATVEFTVSCSTSSFRCFLYMSVLFHPRLLNYYNFHDYFHNLSTITR